VAARINKAAIPSRIQPQAREGVAPLKFGVRISFRKSLI
jgi:hypothetical protein